MAGAGTAALFPLFLGLWDVMVLAAVFTGVFVWSFRRRSLRSIHGVQRPTLGALVFPAGIALAGLAVWEHPAAFSFGCLVLGLADPAAGIAGERWRGVRWPVAGGGKSLAGSTAFAVTAGVLGLMFTTLAGEPRLVPILAAAGALAVIEGSIGYGLDNLILPLAAGLLGERWLGL
jgi:dolichol kinase